MADDSNVPERFLKIVQSFYGCTTGNVDSPVWLCGLEWGGGLSLEAPTYLDSWNPYGFEDLQCWSWQEFKEEFWAPRSKYCQNALKVLLTIQKGHYCEKDYKLSWSELEKHKTVGANGLAMFLNAFPISFAGRSVADKDWQQYEVLFSDGSTKKFPDWLGKSCENFWKYKNFVLEHRAKTYVDERKKRCPKLIVCFGKNSASDFKTLWGVEENAPEYLALSMRKDGNCDCFGYLLDNGSGKQKTLLFITPFIGGPYGLNSPELIENVFGQLRKKMDNNGAAFGPNWLEDYDWCETPNEPAIKIYKEDAIPDTDTRFSYQTCNELLLGITKQKNSICEQWGTLKSINEKVKQIYSCDTSEDIIATINSYQSQLLVQIKAFENIESQTKKEKKIIVSRLWNKLKHRAQTAK